MIKHATPTYEYRGHRITLTPRVPEGVAAYCDGCLLTWTSDHASALATAQVIIDQRLEERLKLHVANNPASVVVDGPLSVRVENNRWTGLGPAIDEWGVW